MNKNRLIGTALALVLLAQNCFAAPNFMAFPHVHNKAGNVEVKQELAKRDAHLQAIFPLPASLGLFTPVASSLIKSIQNVSVQIGASATTGTTTISAVTNANTAIYYGGQSPSTGVNYDVDLGAVTLSGTTLTGTRQTSNTGTVTIYVTIVEFVSSAIQSVQYGSQSTGASASANATITSVTTTNAYVITNGQTCQVASSSGASTCRVNVALTGATTVQVARGTSAGTGVTGYFCVVEHKGSILNSSTQTFSIAITSTSTSNTATITSVTASQAMIAYGGSTNSLGSGAGNQLGYCALTNGTTVTATRVAAANTTTVNGTVVEFPSSKIKSMNRGSTTIASGNTTNAATLSPTVTTSMAASNYLGESNSAAGTTASDNWGNAQLTATNTETLGRGTGGSNTLTVSWEVPEFK